MAEDKVAVYTKRLIKQLTKAASGEVIIPDIKEAVIKDLANDGKIVDININTCVPAALHSMKRHQDYEKWVVFGYHNRKLIWEYIPIAVLVDKTTNVISGYTLTPRQHSLYFGCKVSTNN